jgi:hypothetical protein
MVWDWLLSWTYYYSSGIFNIRNFSKMTDTESQALFKVCAELQKEIRDLKHDGDAHFITIEDMAKKVDSLNDVMDRRLEEELDLDQRIMTVENMIKAVFNLLAK